MGVRIKNPDVVRDVCKLAELLQVGPTEAVAIAIRRQAARDFPDSAGLRLSFSRGAHKMALKRLHQSTLDGSREVPKKGSDQGDAS